MFCIVSALIAGEVPSDAIIFVAMCIELRKMAHQLSLINKMVQAQLV